MSEDVREIELRAIIGVLRRQRRVLIHAFAAVFVVAGLFLALVTPRYAASALVIVDPQGKDILEPARTGGSTGSDNARVDTEVEILKSTTVALDVIDQFGLAWHPEFGARQSLTERLAGAIGVAHAAGPTEARRTARALTALTGATSVRRRGLTYLISVSVTTPDPALSADLANATAQAYIGQQVDTKISATLLAKEKLTAQIEEARATLRGIEDAFDAFFDEGAAKLAELGNTEIAGLRQQLADAHERSQFNSGLRTDLGAAVQDRDWVTVAQRLDDREILRLETARMAILSGNGTAKLDGDAARAEIERLDALLEARGRARLDEIEKLGATLEQEEADLRTAIRDEMVKSDLGPDLLTDIYALQQEADVARTEYQNLLSRQRALDTQSRIQLPDSRIVADALPPVAPAFPNRTLVLLVALAAASGLGVGLAFLNEYYIGGVTSALQLTQLAGAGTVATIPAEPSTNAGRLSVADGIVDAPLSVFSESIRKLRAAADQHFRATAATSPAQERGKVVMVTSALANEGKTTTALALARTYALTGRRTLLIDGDLRRPTVHQHLGLAPKSGFIDFLRDPADPQVGSGFYARDPASPLALILGAGRSEFATDQLLSARPFEELITQARDVYDIIVIDAPPLLPVVDAQYIAPHADAVVVAVRWAATGQSELRAALGPLRTAMPQSAALLPVLTMTSGRSPEGGYDSYYANYVTG